MIMQETFSLGSVRVLYKEEATNRESSENMKGLNLAVVKLTTVHVTKLPL
jgi:hypothetical protein